MPRGEVITSRALIKIDENALPPGAAVTREFTFAEAGDFGVTCHVLGHYEAGTVLAINVQ